MNSNQGTTLITGANGGIGLMIAEDMLKAGERNLAFHYRNENGDLSALLKKYDLDPAKVSFSAELTSEESVAAMGKKIREHFGFVHNVVNVAGSSKNSMSWKIKSADFQEIMNNNVLSAFLCTKEFIPDMREKKSGRIIFFSSVVSLTGVIGAAHYCASKAALLGLTKALSKELASKAITVNAIALGYFSAGLLDDVPEDMKQKILSEIPVNRFGDSAAVGSLVRYLVSEDASYLTGQTLHLNGGLA